MFMNNRKFIIIFFLFLLLGSFAFAFPSEINFHGIIKNVTTGDPINGTVVVNVTYYKISDDSVVKTVQESVNVSEGIWNLKAGSFTDEDFSVNTYVKLKIGGEESNPQNLSSIPYAFVSLKSNNSVFLNGQAAAYYLDNTDTFVNATCSAGEFFNSLDGDSYVCDSPSSSGNDTLYSGHSGIVLSSDNNFTLNVSFVNESVGTNQTIVSKVTQSFVQALGFYTSSVLDTMFGDYINFTLFEANNQSVVDYVLFVNSSNPGGAGSYDDTWINTTTNNSIDDKISSFNDTVIIYIDANDNSDNLTDSDIEAFGYLKFDNTTGLYELISSVDGKLSFYVNLSLLEANNLSMNNRIDSLNGTWTDNSDNLTSADIEELGYFKETNVSGVYETIANVDIKLGSYVNETQLVANNVSLTDYILSVNASNPGGAGSYDDTWINTTTNNSIDDKISSFNDTIVGENTSIIETNSINGTQFNVQDGKLNIITSWLTGVIEGVSKWANYFTKTESEALFINTTELELNNNSLVSYVDARDVINNDSLKVYVTGLNGTWEDNSDNLSDADITGFGYLKFDNTTGLYELVSGVDNKLGSYVNLSLLEANNNSLINYINNNDDSDNLTSSDIEGFGYLQFNNLTGLYELAGSVDTKLGNYVNISLLESNNASLITYVNSNDNSDNLTDSDIEQLGYLKETNVSGVYELISSVDSKLSNYVNESLLVANNNSLINYVDSNDADTVYDDAWINTTTNASIEDKILTNNNSVINYVNANDDSDNLTDSDIEGLGYLKESNTTNYIQDSNSTWVQNIISAFVTLGFVENLGFFNSEGNLTVLLDDNYVDINSVVSNFTNDALYVANGTDASLNNLSINNITTSDGGQYHSNASCKHLFIGSTMTLCIE